MTRAFLLRPFNRYLHDTQKSDKTHGVTTVYTHSIQLSLLTSVSEKKKSNPVWASEIRDLFDYSNIKPGDKPLCQLTFKTK